MYHFLFHATLLAHSRQTTQIKKEMAGQFHGEKGSLLIHFLYQLTREISKIKAKNPGKMRQLIFLNIYPQQQKE